MWQNSHSFLLEKTESRFWKMCLSILFSHTHPRWAWIREATLQHRTRQSPFQLPRCPPIPSRQRHSPMALQWASHQVSTIPSPLSEWWSLTGISPPTSSVPAPSLKTPRGEHQIPPSQRLSRRACKRYQERQSLCVCVLIGIERSSSIFNCSCYLSQKCVQWLRNRGLSQKDA